MGLSITVSAVSENSATLDIDFFDPDATEYYKGTRSIMGTITSEFGDVVWDIGSNGLLGVNYDKDNLRGTKWTIKLSGLDKATIYSWSITLGYTALNSSLQWIPRVYTGDFATKPFPEGEILSITQDKIALYIVGVKTAYPYWHYYRAFVVDENGRTVASTSEKDWLEYDSNFVFELDGLEPDTQYTVAIYVSDSIDGYGRRFKFFEEEFATESIPMPSFSIVSTNEDSVTIYVTSVANAYDYWHYYKVAVTDTAGTRISETAWRSHNDNFYVTLSGLTTQTRYWVTAWVSRYSSGEDPCSDIGQISFTTPVMGLWTWDASNGSATPEETQIAYKILTGKLPLSAGFSCRVWNDFVDKVMKMRGHWGDGTWDRVGGEYLSYQECHVSPGDTLSAHLYNSVKTQIGSIQATWPDVTRHEDELTGNHIVDLAETLNYIIRYKI